MDSDLHSRHPSFRLTSFAGKGLPEKMRSTAFAFLGLTTASALALVAIFAQLSFPLLSPAPLPSEPETRIGDGVPVGVEYVAPLRQAVAAPPSPARSADGGSRTPASGGEPEPGGESGIGNPARGVASPAPSPSPPSTPPAADAPAQAPVAATPPVPAPVAEPLPAPEPSPAPGSSPASSAPGKSSPPGRATAPGQVKKSSPPPVPLPPVATPPAAPAASPPVHSNAGGNRKGNANGHSK